MNSVGFVIIFAAFCNIQLMCAYKVDPIPSTPFSKLGEGPHWDVATQSLYYNDIYGGSIHRFDYKTNKTYSATVDGESVIGFVIPVEGTSDEFAIGVGRRVAVVRWDGKSDKATLVRTPIEVETDEKYRTNRFNDAKADPKGRFFGGTMRLEECGDIFDARQGSLYSYVAGQRAPTQLATNIGVSNGLTWDEQRKKFYYIDSCDLDVKVFDYDSFTGNISNPKTLLDFKLENGDKPAFVPDGMTIDADGNLYVATFGGSSVFKINPTLRKIDLTIKIPAEQVTSVAFGGPNLDILYVTTANIEFKSPQPAPAGQVFQVTGLGTKGLPMSKVKL